MVTWKLFTLGTGTAFLMSHGGRDLSPIAGPEYPLPRYPWFTGELKNEPHWGTHFRPQGKAAILFERGTREECWTTFLDKNQRLCKT